MNEAQAQERNESMSLAGYDKRRELSAADSLKRDARRRLADRIGRGTLVALDRDKDGRWHVR